MERRTRSSLAAVAVGILFALTVIPGVASAHGVSTSRFNAPLPLSLLFGGAGATVALTALWLAVTDVREGAVNRRKRVLTIPARLTTPIRYAVGGMFITLVLAALVVGAVGRQVAAENFTTVFTWPVWFRGVALLAILLGNPWPVISPWRTIYRGLSRLEGRPLAVLGEYPRRISAWPALVGFLVLIGIVENLTVIPRSPRSTAVLIALYALAMVGGAVLWGRSWLRRADPLGVLYRLFGRVAPIQVDERANGAYEVSLRPPWQGCLDPVRSIPLVIFVVATVYTVSFDGFTNTSQFQTVLFDLRNALGTGAGTSVFLYVAGLVGFVAVFLLSSWLVERLGAGTGRSWLDAARWLAPTVLPIAAAYEVAHNYPYVVRNVGQLVALVLRPVFPAVDPI